MKPVLHSLNYLGLQHPHSQPQTHAQLVVNVDDVMSLERSRVPLQAMSAPITRPYARYRPISSIPVRMLIPSIVVFCHYASRLNLVDCQTSYSNIFVADLTPKFRKRNPFAKTLNKDLSTHRTHIGVWTRSDTISHSAESNFTHCRSQRMQGGHG